MKIKDTWNTPRGGAQMKNPFSKGNSCLNYFSTICGPLPPSFLNLRAVVIPDEDTHRIRIMNMNNTEEIIRYQPDDYVRDLSVLT